MVKKLPQRMFGNCLVTTALGSGLPALGLARLGYSSFSFNPPRKPVFPANQSTGEPHCLATFLARGLSARRGRC
jgi:hypothetical protein